MIMAGVAEGFLSTVRSGGQSKRPGAGRSARPKEACGPLRSGTRLGLRTRGSRARSDFAGSSAPLLFRTTAQPHIRRPMTNG